MSLYSRFAGSQFGSSALFGGAFFAATLVADGAGQALATGAAAAAAWFAVQPLLKRLVEGIHRA